MKNQYRLLKERQEKEVNAFPLMAAFSKEQFLKGMEKLNVTSEKELLDIGCGCFIRKIDKEKFTAMFEKQEQERKQAIEQDIDGSGYIKDMFQYELGNHEYIITGDLSETLDALDITVKEINESKKLLNGLKLGLDSYLQEDN